MSDVLAKNRFIVSPVYDSVYFIFAPIIALLVAMLASYSASEIATFIVLSVVAMDFGHTFIVFFRSHNNANIYKTHPLRFTLIPLLLIAAISFSNMVFAIAVITIIFWDIYHIAMQVFGIGRIYDSKMGNDSEIGRRLDYVLNLFLFVGPLLAGGMFLASAQEFLIFENVGVDALAELPKLLFKNQNNLSWAAIIISAIFLPYYLYSYWKLHKAGYEISVQKIVLYTIMGICSIYAWCFNSIVDGYIIMNFFHALQYHAIIWHFEKKNMDSFFNLNKAALGRKITLILFLAVSIGYGFWALNFVADYDQLYKNYSHYLSHPFTYAVIMTVTIMHYWYDGFIWSVRKGQV